MSEKTTRYPSRLSVAEPRNELKAYVKTRSDDHADGTVSLDRRKVEYFPAWLDHRLQEATP
jgi:hypothetical protein